jgi:hypothetical protein
VVRKYTAKPGHAELCTAIRFTDDFVMTLKKHRDAKGVLGMLETLFGWYSSRAFPERTPFIAS